MKRLLQRKTSNNSIWNRRPSTLLDRQALGVLIIAIAGVVSFASPAQPGPALLPDRAVIGAADAGQGSATEALFDLASPAAGPFPSDWFTVHDDTQNTHRRVSLPKPDCQVYVSDCEDLDVLNELDGFNVQPRLSVPFSGPIDVNTVTSDTLFLVSLGSTGSGQDDMPQGMTGRGSGEYRQPQGGDYMPWGTVVGINQVVWDPSTKTLHVESDELLAQHTRFALIVTRGIRDASGALVQASEAFRRFRADVRTEYKQALLDAILAARQIGVREEDIVAASVFTTQSATAILEKIRDQIHEATPDPANFLLGPNDMRTVFSVNQITSITWSQQTQVNPPGFTLAPPIDLSLLSTVGSIAFGKYLSPDYAVHPGEYIPPVGTRSGAPEVQGINDIYFNLFLPSGPKPTNGWPIAIYVTGVGGTKDVRALEVVSSLAKHGIATIAINNVAHGFGPLSTLTVTGIDGTPITFLAGGRSIDQDGNNKIDNTEGLAARRPRVLVFLSDAYRQTAADLMQLVRVIEVGMDVDGDGQRDLDPFRIYLFGSSLGGGISTVFASVEPDVRVGVLNVPFDPPQAGGMSCVRRSNAGALFAIRQPPLLNSPGIMVLDGCKLSPPPFFFDENFPLRDQIPLTVQLTDGTTRVIQSPVTNTVVGAMALQEVGENFKWVGQAGSPLAYAPHLRMAPLAGVPPKSVLFLIAKGDQSATNPSTTAILRAGDLADRSLYYLHDVYRNLHPNLPANPHEFATKSAVFGEISLGVQDMVGKFFFSDGVLLIVPEPSKYFEFPIVLPLPEALNYIK